MEKYDLIIIGAGPAGLSAAVYASRYKINFLVISKEVGGQVTENHRIENYLGFPDISGYELGQKFKQHAESLGAKIKSDTVSSIEKEAVGFQVVTSSGQYQGSNIIFALGSKYRRLMIPGESEFKGKGVSYCATCDGPFFKDKKVIVVGGGNSAAGAATLLAKYAKQVRLVYRGNELKCDPSYIDQMSSFENIEVECCANVKEIKGEQKVEAVVVDRPIEGKTELETDGVFVEIGSDPSVEMLIPLGIALNDRHFIVVGPDQSTNIEGIFAAGDLTTNSNSFRQIITAASEGAIAAASAYERIKSQK